MPFVKKEFYIDRPIKAFLFLIREFNLNQREAQRFIDKGRLFVDKKPFYDKKATIDGLVEVVYFEAKGKGLKPIFETDNFLAYNKPSGVLVHPNNMKTEYSMLDEVRVYGKDVNIVHRLDLETSGVLLVSKNKSSERYLKSLFEKRKIQKSYLAWVRGKAIDSFEVEEKIRVRKDYSKDKFKVEISQDGKYAKTEFESIQYDKIKNRTLLKCKPLTGRTHQIRIHLFHTGHPIVGDPIYGTSFEFATKYLEGQIPPEERTLKTGASRVLLHAHSLEFYYNDNFYRIEAESHIS